MDCTLQIWLIVISLALTTSIFARGIQASVSRAQILCADQVLENAPDGVARIQRDVSIVRKWPIQEARALSVGVTAATIALFRNNGMADKRQKW